MKYISNNFLYSKKLLPNAVSQLLSHFANAKNMVKKFAGHYLHNAANQAIVSQKLSHAVSQISTICGMVKKIVEHTSNYVAYQMIAGRKLSHAILGRRENTRLKPDYLVNIFAILRFFPFLCDVNE